MIAARALAVLALLALPHAAAAQERRLSLEEAVRMALEKNEGLMIERESAIAAAAAVSGAKGAYDPLLEAEGAWSKSKQPLNSVFSGADPLGPEDEASEALIAIRQLLPTGGRLSVSGGSVRATTESSAARYSPAYSTRAGVTLRQPLLRDLWMDADRLAVRSAKAGRRAADAGLLESTTNTVAAVERSYWTLMALRLGVEVLRDATRLAEEQLEQTRLRVESGSAPGTEIAQPRAELERRRGDVFGGEELVARAENALKLLILGGTDDPLWRATLVPSDTAMTEAAPIDLTAETARALERRPEIEASMALLDRRRAETSFAKNGVWPALDAVASYDRYGLSGTPVGTSPSPSGDLDQSLDMLSDGDYDAARVALVLSLPLPNRSARAAATIARSVERQAEADLVRVRKEILAEVLDAAAVIQTASQRIEATRSAREAAQIQLDAEADRYASGLSTNFLVLTRQNDLAQARLDEISALTDYRRARTELARATGSLIEQRGIDLTNDGMKR